MWVLASSSSSELSIFTDDDLFNGELANRSWLFEVIRDAMTHGELVMAVFIEFEDIMVDGFAGTVSLVERDDAYVCDEVPGVSSTWI